MKKTIALIATIVLLASIVPGLALAQVYEGDLVIDEPGAYSDLQVNGNIIIRCGDVILKNVSCGTIIVEGVDANVIIDRNCVVESVVIAEGSTGAAVEVRGIVTGSVIVLADAVNMTFSDTSVVNNIVVGENASAVEITVEAGAQLESFTNNSDTTTINATEGVISIIEGDAVIVNEVYAI